jgi:hypothetical protein
MPIFAMCRTPYDISEGERAGEPPVGTLSFQLSNKVRMLYVLIGLSFF